MTSPRKRHEKVWLVRFRPDGLSDFFRLFTRYELLKRNVIQGMESEAHVPWSVHEYDIFEIDFDRIGEPGGIREVTGHFMDIGKEV